MASTLKDIIKKAAQDTGKKTEDVEEASSGIQIERQNVESIRGSAKSGQTV